MYEVGMVRTQGEAAKQASLELGILNTRVKNDILESMAEGLLAEEKNILEANAVDMEEGRKGGLRDSLLDRLLLTHDRLAQMAEGIRQVAGLPDPVGRILSGSTLANGLTITKVSVPLGVIAIIFESRPNVTSDAAALALKSGNVCVLRCGKEAHSSASAIVDALQSGLESVGLSKDLVLLVEDITRQSANELMTADGYVDLLIPRGGKGLITACLKNATVPCIQTGTGICHIYVDESADIDMALNIVENAKTSRPSVCNAAEVCLIHRAVADRFLPMVREKLGKDRFEAGLQPVELRLDEKALAILPGIPAGFDDFDTEFLDYILAVKVVEDLDEAIAHIAAHSTGHSEAIITSDPAAADRFTRLVDSAAVYVNASTRFTDGGQFGLGCEMGISTQKLHARGPMGLEELTSYKYVVRGNGQIR